ncbi:endonuclease/exonuclease/phosphatase family protein [Maribacter sp. MMG018]|uniref:endonuclease/exonuclease/phosphatase family protein n=1 Tax=Maribacter sp. MMG018 TaxID=2822688 RepID=UPI001B392A2A|nr:endonuclease/exonuclease/phosphatase family protein [Maribacter sp. MMG018]MBQ4914745.1 endonuclease/exonuclease/phosphatase family protein [Maribacter sp. MMG018]
MKRFKIILSLTILLVVSNSYCQTVKVLTYNIKYDNVNDTVNNWNDRKGDMVKLLKFYSPDIIGMQEVLERQLVYLDESLPQYKAIGVGREDGKKKGEYSPILYNADNLKLLKDNTFWLSETPDKVSIGWDAALERICTYGLFEEINSKKRFWVFNTHFDHKGVLAREKSAELIALKIKEINKENLPVVLMGDLNRTPETKPIQFLKKELTDGQTATKKAFYGPTGTFSGFDHNKILDERIDYIFVHNFEVNSYQHIDDRMENNKHISDHLPVMAHLTMH